MSNASQRCSEARIISSRAQTADRTYEEISKTQNRQGDGMIRSHKSRGPFRFKVNWLLLLAFGLFAAQLAVGQASKECKVTKTLTGKFKVVGQGRPLGNSDELVLDVVIKPRNFTSKFMRDFAKRIDETYCNEKLIGVSIFESEKDAGGWFYDFVTSGGKVDRRRGAFVLDRTCGKNSLGYSSKKGRSIDEFEIDNSKIIGKCRLPRN